MTFVFKRRYGWYILQGYIPTYLTIFISWISFYLGSRAIPARTMIGELGLIFCRKKTSIPLQASTPCWP